MSCVSDARDGDLDVIRFAWDGGGGGTLQITWRAGAVAGLTVTSACATVALAWARDRRRGRHDMG